MSESAQPETSPTPPRQTHLRRWMVGMVCLLGLAALLRLGYPAYRQRQIVAALQAKGLNVQVMRFFGDDWPKWMTAKLDEVLIQAALLEDDKGLCTDDDLKSISELFALTYDDMDGTPDCELVLQNAVVTDAGLSHLRGARNLSYLDLGSEHVTDAGIAHLSGLRLRYLTLTSTPITNSGLAHLQTLTSLEYLDLSDTRITDAGLAHLAGLDLLEELNLDDTQITAAGLVHLLKLKRLKSLRLAGSHVWDDGVPELMRFTKLQQLDLSRTRITNKGFAKVSHALPYANVDW